MQLYICNYCRDQIREQDLYCNYGIISFLKNLLFICHLPTQCATFSVRCMSHILVSIHRHIAKWHLLICFHKMHSLVKIVYSWGAPANMCTKVCTCVFGERERDLRIVVFPDSSSNLVTPKIKGFKLDLPNTQLL